MSSRTNPLPGGDTLTPSAINVSRGVYALEPAQTPKYGQQGADGTLAEDVARLYVEVDNDEDVASFRSNVAAYQGAASDVVDVISSYGKDFAALGYVDFFLEAVNHSFQEKVQLNEVLSDNYVSYFFGQRPVTFTFSGKLMNTRQDDWSSGFYQLYDAVMRGTRMADLKKVVHLRYDRRIASGVLISLSESLTSSMQMVTDFTATMLVKSYTIFPDTQWVPTHLTEQLLTEGPRFQSLQAVNAAGNIVETSTSNATILPADNTAVPQQATVISEAP